MLILLYTGYNKSRGVLLREIGKIERRFLNGKKTAISKHMEKLSH